LPATTTRDRGFRKALPPQTLHCVSPVIDDKAYVEHGTYPARAHLPE
jgi:hypothetical protein